jgi:hypothetical protein
MNCMNNNMCESTSSTSSNVGCENESVNSMSTPYSSTTGSMMSAAPISTSFLNRPSYSSNMDEVDSKSSTAPTTPLKPPSAVSTPRQPPEVRHPSSLSSAERQALYRGDRQFLMDHGTSDDGSINTSNFRNMNARHLFCSPVTQPVTGSPSASSVTTMITSRTYNKEDGTKFITPLPCDSPLPSTPSSSSYNNSVITPMAKNTKNEKKGRKTNQTPKSSSSASASGGKQTRRKPRLNPDGTERPTRKYTKRETKRQIAEAAALIAINGSPVAAAAGGTKLNMASPTTTTTTSTPSRIDLSQDNTVATEADTIYQNIMNEEDSNSDSTAAGIAKKTDKMCINEIETDVPFSSDSESEIPVSQYKSSKHKSKIDKRNRSILTPKKLTTSNSIAQTPASANPVSKKKSRLSMNDDDDDADVRAIEYGIQQVEGEYEDACQRKLSMEY